VSNVGVERFLKRYGAEIIKKIEPDTDVGRDARALGRRRRRRKRVRRVTRDRADTGEPIAACVDDSRRGPWTREQKETGRADYTKGPPSTEFNRPTVSRIPVRAQRRKPPERYRGRRDYQ